MQEQSIALWQQTLLKGAPWSLRPPVMLANVDVNDPRFEMFKKKSALQMFYEEGKAFSTSVRPRGQTQRRENITFVC